MTTISKKDLILHEIIRAYLEENLPIGSSQLGLRLDDKIPASTIRVYFKKLSDEGELTKLHISGGRIPTQKAMRDYWGNVIDFTSTLNIANSSRFSDLVTSFGLFCMISEENNSRLNEVVNVEDRFLILIFGDEKVVLDYEPNEATFLAQLVGSSIKDLKHLAHKFSLQNLEKELDYLIEKKVIFKKGEENLFKNSLESIQISFLIEDFPFMLSHGLFFDDYLPEGFMAVKKPVVFDGRSSSLYCLGELYTDFEDFFRQTKEIA